MLKRLILTPDYAEDHLPPGQDVIETKGVEHTRRYLALLRSSKLKTGYSTIGIITGGAGLGKTIAVQAFIDQFRPLAHTGLLPVVKVKVEPSSTPPALAKAILASLDEEPAGSNRFDFTDQAVDAIGRNDVDMMTVDEAEWLNRHTFDVLRKIHDKTGLLIVVVGLPEIWNVIRQQEKFASRVGPGMRFPPCSEDDMLTLVLPNLVLPHWVYDPNDKSDLEMGKRIYEMVGSSLRKLQNVLVWANEIAEVDQEPRITVNTIKEAFGWMRAYRDRCGQTDGNEEPLSETSVLEFVSEARHRAKDVSRNTD